MPFCFVESPCIEFGLQNTVWGCSGRVAAVGGMSALGHEQPRESVGAYATARERRRHGTGRATTFSAPKS